MSHPLEKDLLIELEVDAKIGETWYECKWLNILIFIQSIIF